METPQSQQDKNKQSSNRPPVEVPKGGWWFIAIFAALVFIAFIVLVTYMALHALVDEKTDIDWNKLVFLFTSVETIVFAAASFIFGREVNRKSANANTQRADTADKQRLEAEKERAKAEQELNDKLVQEKKEKEKLKKQLEQLEQQALDPGKPEIQSTLAPVITNLIRGL